MVSNTKIKYLLVLEVTLFEKFSINCLRTPFLQQPKQHQKGNSKLYFFLISLRHFSEAIHLLLSPSNLTNASSPLIESILISL